MKSNLPYANSLAYLMQKAGITNLEQLSKISGLSSWQLARIQYGLLPKMSVENLLKLAKALQLSPDNLLTYLSSDLLSKSTENQVILSSENNSEIESLQIEYQRLEQQLAQQREILTQEIQDQVIMILESWLLQWPTAAAAAQKDPEFSAVKLLPLVRPLNNLLKHWQIEAIASVGEMVNYDPQWHQLMEGNAQLGTSVIVRYVGYRQGQKLLYRAKVSPVMIVNS